MKLLVTSVLAMGLLGVPAKAQLSSPGDAGIAMGHVHLNVKDIDAQKKFWMKHFAAVPLQKESLQGVKVPGMLILFAQRAPTAGSEGSVLDHFGFRIPDMAQALKDFRADGFKVAREFTGTEGFPNAYIIGPDDVKIELQEDKWLRVKAVSHHLHWLTADTAAIRDWYAKTFSFQPTMRGAYNAANLPGENLTFQTPAAPDKPPTIGTKGRALDHIGFEVKNLEAFCKKLEASGVKLDSAYRKVPNLGIALAFLTDPLGVYIELTEGLDTY